MAYIDKELFKQDIKMRYCNNCARPSEIKCRACHIDDMLGEIEDAPTADVEEVKHGEWKKISVASEHGYGQVYYQHSSCEVNSTELFQSPYERCPRCGAKMDAERSTP